MAETLNLASKDLKRVDCWEYGGTENWPSNILYEYLIPTFLYFIREGKEKYESTSLL